MRPKTAPAGWGKETKAHISFPDPAKATGTDEEKMTVLRKVRNDIRQQVLPFLTTAS